MTAGLKSVERRIIPRWRLSPQAGDPRELGSLRPPKVAPEFDVRFDEKLREWMETPTLYTAAEIVSAAVAAPPRSEAAAKEVLRAAKLVKESLDVRLRLGHSVADRFLQDDLPDAPEAPPGRCFDVQRETIYVAIQMIRARLHREPRNVLLWVDLARRYTDLGQINQALRSMDIALKLAPENRFVVRAAIRLVLHAGDPKYAHQLARRSPLAAADPWIIAAEVSTASIAEVSPRLTKAGERMLKAESFDPIHLTELAGVLGTEELNSGNVRRARQLFRQALIDPTENSAAQVEWVAHQENAIRVEPEQIENPGFYEARAWEHYYAGNWKECVREACLWAKDQFFSTWPVALASYVSATFLEDYELSNVILEMGLIANPRDPLLLNNRTYALACAGRLDEAEKTFSQIDRKDPAGLNDTTYVATKGLLLYRRNEPEAGAFHYLRAIDLAQGPKNRKLRARATLFFAREELRSKSPTAAKAVELAEKASEGINDADVREILARLLAERDRDADPAHVG